MKILFFGTPEFAIPSLKRLSKEHQIVGVVTQIDRPKGRGLKVAKPPIAFTAERLNRRLFQPKKIESSLIEELEPEIIVVVAYGKILPKEILKIPKMGCINLHPSLLPKLRGPAPIHWAIIKGEKTTGVTVCEMAEEVDSGRIIAQEAVEIADDDNAESLSTKLSEKGAEVLSEALKMIEEKKVEPKPQEGEPSYAPKIGSLKIDWKKPNTEVFNLIRGLSPHPSAYTHYDRKRLKILKAILREERAGPARIVSVKKEGLLVGCREGSLLITKVHPENKKPMSAFSWWNGVRKKCLSFD